MGNRVMVQTRRIHNNSVRYWATHKEQCRAENESARANANKSNRERTLVEGNIKWKRKGR